MAQGLGQPGVPRNVPPSPQTSTTEVGYQPSLKVWGEPHSSCVSASLASLISIMWLPGDMPVLGFLGACFASPVVPS